MLKVEDGCLKIPFFGNTDIMTIINKACKIGYILTVIPDFKGVEHLGHLVRNLNLITSKKSTPAPVRHKNQKFIV